jgi:chitinase
MGKRYINPNTLLLLFLPLAVSQLTISCTKYKTAEVPIVLAYYANFEDKRPVSSVPFNGLDYINHSFIYPDALDMIDSRDVNPHVDELVSVAMSNGAGVLVSLGMRKGSLERYVAIAKDSARTERFAGLLVKFCTDHRYAGLDLNWETPKVDEALLYLQFVSIISRELKKQSLLFSITLPGQYDKTYFLDYVKLSRQVDWINLMTYDFGNSDPLKCIHNTPFGEIVENVDRFSEKVLPEKLVLGLAFYGRKYGNVDTFTIGSSGVKDSSLYRVDSIRQKQSDPGWIKKYDKEQEVPFMYKPSLRELVSYDSDSSLRIKLDYVRERKFKGVMFWAIDFDAALYQNSFQRIVADWRGEK